MLTVKKIHSQKYVIKAERGQTSVRDDALKRVFWNHSKHQPGYIFTPAYKSGRWNGKVNLFSATDIRAGFLREALDELDNKGIEWQWEGNKIPDHLPFRYDEHDDFTYEEFRSFCEKLIKGCGPKFKEKHGIDLEIRDYQIDAAFKFLKRKIGIALHATSAGKSLMIAFILGFLFYKNMIEKAVILVPLQSLVTQFYRDLIDYGFKEGFVGKLYSDEKQTSRPITVAMTVSSHNMIDTLEGEDFFKKTDILICDEVHKSAAKTVTETIMNFTEAKYFFGCTGTLPEAELDQDRVFSMFGHVLDTRKLKELQEEYNAVSNVKVGILNFSYGEKAFLSNLSFKTSTDDWHSEVRFLQGDDEFRNPYIVNTLVNNYNQGRNIVVLVKNIEYGLKMYDKIGKEVDTKNKKCVFWIDGSTKLQEVDRVIDKCKSGDIQYIIVTDFQKFSTGVNIPNIDVVCFCDSAKSKITVAQSIGRGVRKTKTKDEVIILDCACDLKYGARHSRIRKKLYEKEGFEVYEKTIYKDEDKELKGKIKSLNT